jgi:nucleotide-binding universal stress UspA family protein
VLVVPDPEASAHHLALRRLLVAIDGTPSCLPAIDLAADLAARFGARVELVRAIDDSPVFPLGPATRVTMDGEATAPALIRDDSEPYCQQVRDHGVPVHLTVERGEPDEVVRQVAARLDADLIIAATHRTGDLDADLLASISRRIVHVAHRPTLVIPAEHRAGQLPSHA